MKGIVAEFNGKYAIILAQDGSFRKIKAAVHMTVGSEIDLNQPAGNVKVVRLMSKVSAIAAAALLIMGIGFGAYSYTLPFSYVDVDINPSIEITTNVYDRIIKVEALNDDGKKLLDNGNLKNARLEVGVSQLLNAAVEHGYLKAGTIKPNSDENEAAGDNQTISRNAASSESADVIENAVLFTVSSKNSVKSGELRRQLAAMASKELERDSVNSEVLIGEASVEQRDNARKVGVTPGKLALIEGAMEGESELKFEELKKAAVKDLVKQAKDKKIVEDKQKTAVESVNSIGKSDGATTDQKEEAALDDQNVKQEQTNALEQLQQKLKDLNKNKETILNDEDKQQNNKSNKSNNIDKTDINDEQDKADILKREKQQRQRLKDELLEQVKGRKQVQKGIQEEKSTSNVNEKKVKDVGKEAANKDSKGTSRQK